MAIKQKNFIECGPKYLIRLNDIIIFYSILYIKTRSFRRLCRCRSVEMLKSNAEREQHQITATGGIIHGHGCRGEGCPRGAYVVDYHNAFATQSFGFFDFEYTLRID